MASAVALSALKRFRVLEFTALERASVSKPTSLNSKADQVQTLPNPFLPHKQKNGGWAKPKYSLRRQADILKQAKLAGRLDLLPPGRKYDPFALTGPPAPKKTEKKAEAAEGSTEQAAVGGGVVAAQAEASVNAGDAMELEVPMTESATSPVVQKTAAAQAKIQNPRLSLDPSLEAWEQPVIWEGELKRRWVPGANIGARLYAGKKRMFKGHAWERKFVKRRIRINILMRDMKKRIWRYKTWHKLRRAKPLRSSPTGTKLKKLPF